MKKDPLIFIEHITESIENIELYSKDVSKDNFLKDKKIQDAVVRRLEVIGEAVKNLPKDFIKKYPDIFWKEIIGTRDKIIHHYFGVDLDIMWVIIKKDIPKLKNKIKKILNNIK